MAKPTNIGTAATKNRDAISNRSASQNVFDVLRAHFEEVSKKSSEIGTDGKFYGYVLYCNKLTIENFQQTFKNNDQFLTDILGASAATTDTVTSAEVLEMYVYVPQLSDFLPEPDIALLNQFIKLRKNEKVKELLKQSREERSLIANASNASTQTATAEIAVTSTSAAEKTKANIEAQKLYKQLQETLNIITMYPRVYKYTETSEYYAPGTVCEVEFPADKNRSISSMGFGIYTRELSGAPLDLGNSVNSNALELFIQSKGIV